MEPVRGKAVKKGVKSPRTPGGSVVSNTYSTKVMWLYRRDPTITTPTATRTMIQRPSVAKYGTAREYSS
jgi:hypothetical protein